VLAACPGLTSVPDINSTGSCRCQTAAPEATGNTLNCRRKSGLIPRLVQPVSLGMAPTQSPSTRPTADFTALVTGENGQPVNWRQAEHS
jgi:hypothetical protein